MSWYATAMGFIKQQKLEHPEMSHEELRKHCSKNYPFGERRMWPYKAWLQAMRDEFGRSRPAPSDGSQESLL